jgi:hypothetical protein
MIHSPLYPSSWDNPALGAIFRMNSATATSISPSTISTGSSSPSQATTNPANSTNKTPAIAGGIVGGVVALAAVLAALWWFYFRRRNASKPQDMPELGQPIAWEMEAGNKPAELEVPEAISREPVQHHEVQA